MKVEETSLSPCMGNGMPEGMAASMPYACFCNLPGLLKEGAMPTQTKPKPLSNCRTQMCSVPMEAEKKEMIGDKKHARRLIKKKRKVSVSLVLMLMACL